MFDPFSFFNVLFLTYFLGRNLCYVSMTETNSLKTLDFSQDYYLILSDGLQLY